MYIRILPPASRACQTQNSGNQTFEPSRKSPAFCQFRENKLQNATQNPNPNHTFLRLSQDEYFVPFFRQYFDLLKSNLQSINVMVCNGSFSHSYYTCGEHHNRQNPNWKLFQLLERHCLEAGYDFFEARDMIEERIGRRLRCECEILK
ncbi:MAG: hypothetical protein HY895_02615 [Deltaproteobacteria bacterium]|nr:hypothetical protein [Deltaproteobacteria bacterium]